MKRSSLVGHHGPIAVTLHETGWSDMLPPPDIHGCPTLLVEHSQYGDGSIGVLWVYRNNPLTHQGPWREVEPRNLNEREIAALRGLDWTSRQMQEAIRRWLDS